MAIFRSAQNFPALVEYTVAASRAKRQADRYSQPTLRAAESCPEHASEWIARDLSNVVAGSSSYSPANRGKRGPTVPLHFPVESILPRRTLIEFSFAHARVHFDPPRL